MLISEEFRSEQYKRHITDPEYGGEAVEYSAHISNVINQTQVGDVLDYGCGKGELGANLELDHRVRVHLYDPAIPDIAEAPEPQDMVVCVNVLDYVEKDCIEDVLDDLKRCTKHIIFIVISENELKMEYWLPKIMTRFRVQSLVRSNIDFFVVATVDFN